MSTSNDSADIVTADFKYWGPIHTPLTEIFTTLVNRIDRDERPGLIARCQGTPMWLLTHLRVAQNTWDVILALAQDRKTVALGLGAGAAIPPLARVICESVVSVIFTFEDLATRLPWAWRATWRNMIERYEEHAAVFGTRPEWATWLAGYQKQCDDWRATLAQMGTPITADELAGRKKIPYWPTPGRMRAVCKDPQRDARIAHFDAFYYGDLSSRTHLAGTGLIVQAGVVGIGTDERFQRNEFAKLVTMGLSLMFSLASAVCLDVVPDPPLARRLVALWQTPKLGDIPVETYQTCFKPELEALAAK